MFISLLRILVLFAFVGALTNLKCAEKLTRVVPFYPVIKLIHDIELNPGPGQCSRKDNIKIAHLNVRSLKRRVHFIQVKDTILLNDFDVFTISESWLDSSVTNLEIEIPGYNIFRVDRQQQRGGGVCAYVKQCLKTEILREISGISSNGLHQLWMKIQLRKFKSFLVCTTYRPPSSPVACLEDDLGASLISALLLSKPIYILGDINCNLLQPDLPESQALSSFCSTYNLEQLISSATRTTESTMSLIDVILVSNSKHVIKSSVLHSSISDHDLVYVTLRLKRDRNSAAFVTKRSFKEYSKENFANEISFVPWSVVDIFDDPDDKLYIFNSLFNQILDEHAPVKTFCIKGKPNPYITDEIRQLMATRDNCKREFKRTRDPLAWSAYKNFCREVKTEIRMAEKVFVSLQIQDNKNNTNTMWKAIRSCIPKKSQSKTTFSKDSDVVANDFNNFFASVGKNTAEKVNSMAEQFKNNSNDNSNAFVPKEYPRSEQFSFNDRVSCDHVERVISSMSSNKAPGIDKIPMHVIKDCLPSILPSITSIINATFNSSLFPIDWKRAEVVPIPKDGDPEIPSNNRPISLLPILSKVCERVAHDQLTSYFLINQRLSPKQMGNKKWNSTETSVILTTDSILEGIDKKKLSAIVLLDFSKAFDSINHNVLMDKLQDVGLSAQAIEWFNSYLSPRYQTVRIDSSYSDFQPLSCGVPQGSILGPLLFNIYINDLPSIATSCTTQCYVDDTKLLLTFSLDNKENAICNMNDDLSKLSNWTFANFLLLNPEKTKLMVFGSRAMTAKVGDFRLTLLGKEILPVDCAKDLGVMLDSNLTYKNHVESTVSSCMSRLGQINRVKHAFNTDTLKILINALVFSKLYYCSNVWCNTTENNLNRIQAVQNFAGRIICDKRKFDHITPVLKKLRWIPVRLQLYYRNAVLAFKCMTGCAPEALTSRFVQRSTISKRSTRNSQKLQIPLCKTATGQRSFNYRTVNLWNGLDTELKLATNVDMFKRKLKSLLISSFLKSD